MIFIMPNQRFMPFYFNFLVKRVDPYPFDRSSQTVLVCIRPNGSTHELSKQ